MAKTEIRERMRRLLTEGIQSISSTQRLERATAVATFLERDSAFQSANIVALFASRRDEISTLPIYERCLQLGKRVLFPVVYAENKTLEFFPLQSSDLQDGMTAGAHGIHEPVVEEGAQGERQVDLFIMPGFAFSPEGARLGRGTGYYDRTLCRQEFCESLRYGISYSFQIVEDLPMEAFDLFVHKVFTPDQVFEPRRSPTGRSPHIKGKSNGN